MRIFKNKKGQALIEAVIIINIMLLLFFAMILFSVYVYDKMVVVFSANLAIDEAIGIIPEPGMTGPKVEALMKNSGNSALEHGLFLKSQNVVPRVNRKKDSAEISVTVTAEYSMQMPFVSEFLNNNVISHTSSVNYSW